MDKITFVSKSIQDTSKLALALAKTAFSGECVLLEGQLGAGKTALSKAFGKAVGVIEDITSPTFNILKVYESGQIPFYHIDAYRLENGNEDIGLEEYIHGDGVTFIEWPLYIKDLLPKEHLLIQIGLLGDNEREFVLSALGEPYEKALSEIEELLK